MYTPVIMFSKSNKVCVGYFDPIDIMFNNYNELFLGAN